MSIEEIVDVINDVIKSFNDKYEAYKASWICQNMIDSVIFLSVTDKSMTRMIELITSNVYGVEMRKTLETELKNVVYQF